MGSKISIQNVTDPSFKKYGKIIEGIDCSELLDIMQTTPLPDDVVYVPSMKEMEAADAAARLRNSVYGGMPIQMGYCNGHNVLLNAVEYHRDSEVDIAVTDLILLLGSEQDITAGYTYDTSLVEAFYVPAGTAVELYATTLHYAPCQTDENGFRCVIVLPEGTNTDFEPKPADTPEDKLITARNKWLIAHPDAGIDGAFEGLQGENISVE